MTNHFHLLLYPKGREELIKLMKDISQHHAQYINRKYNRSGKLWENRYKLNIVDPEYEWVIARYIEQNPVMAGIVSEAEEYKYSSARSHVNGEIDEILGRDIIEERGNEYCEFMRDKLEADRQSQIQVTIQQEKVLGKQDFIDCMGEKFETTFQVRGRGRPVKAVK